MFHPFKTTFNLRAYISGCMGGLKLQGTLHMLNFCAGMALSCAKFYVGRNSIWSPLYLAYGFEQIHVFWADVLVS